jgi:hypothetical protein
MRGVGIKMTIYTEVYMATTTIKQIYDKAPAAASGDDDILLIVQNEATKGVKLKDATAGKAKKATDAEYAAHLGADGAPLSVGTEETPIYINKNGIPKVCTKVAAATADASAYAQKIGTPQAHPAIGNTSTPIFINSDGIATACTDIHATLANAGSAGIPIYTQGNTVRECANFGVCQTATNTMDKAVTITGFVRKAGAHFYVKFANDGGGTRGAYNLTLNVHDGNANTGAAPVYVGKYQCGIGAINAGCVYEMLYDGEHYVILNSDIVAQETGETANYVKHGNGLLIQWGDIRLGTTVDILAYTNVNSYRIVQGFNYYNNNVTELRRVSEHTIGTIGGPSESVVLAWLTIGY